MTTETAVLVDWKDRRIGKVRVASICHVIQHKGCTFARSGQFVRLRPSDRVMATVFNQTEIFVREKLEPV